MDISCSRLYPKRQRGWAQFGPWGHVARGLGGIRAVCRAWQAISTFSALGKDKANPPVSASPIPVCLHKCGEAVFCARHFYFLFFVKIVHDRQQTPCGEHNATTLPHSRSSGQHHVCVHGVSSLCCGGLFVSESVICHPTIPHIYAVLSLRAHVHRATVSATSPGLGFLHPLSPCTYARFGEAISARKLLVLFCGDRR